MPFGTGQLLLQFFAITSNRLHLACGSRKASRKASRKELQRFRCCGHHFDESHHRRKNFSEYLSHPQWTADSSRPAPEWSPSLHYHLGRRAQAHNSLTMRGLVLLAGGTADPVSIHQTRTPALLGRPTAYCNSLECLVAGLHPGSCDPYAAAFTRLTSCPMALKLSDSNCRLPRIATHGFASTNSSWSQSSASVS